MQIDKYSPSLSRNTMLQMLVTAIILGALVVLNLDYLRDVYFSNQLTTTGIFVNGLILVMFLLGIFRLVANLLYYRHQEVAISSFLENDSINPDMAMANIDESTLIAQRYQAMRALRLANASIDHGALAAILVANESARSSVPKFVNNILILTGVFGTIVSLSIALIGASDLLQTADNLNGMNLVVHGMSTALSTTITAIVCFMYFGYFHLRTTDIQTRIISLLERVTLEKLMPRFTVSQENVLNDIANLVKALRNVSDAMKQAQIQSDGSIAAPSAIDEQVSASILRQDQQLQQMNGQLSEMLATLRTGFRLDH